MWGRCASPFEYCLLFLYIIFHYFARCGIYFVFVFVIAALKVYFVYHYAVLAVELAFEFAYAAFAYARVGKGDLLCLCFAYVCAFGIGGGRGGG